MTAIICSRCDGEGRLFSNTTSQWNPCSACKGIGAITVDEPAPVSPEVTTAYLIEWWRTQAEAEITKMAPKAIEYGSYDLDLVGKVLGDMLGREPNSEMGIAFYLLGKIARVVSAYRDGLRPADDTWVDISIYAKMVTYMREHEGRWP